MYVMMLPLLFLCENNEMKRGSNEDGFGEEMGRRSNGQKINKDSVSRMRPLASKRLSDKTLYFRHGPRRT